MSNHAGDVAHRILEQARKKADAAEVIYGEAESGGVRFQDNQLKTVSGSATRGVGVRVIHRGRLGFSSTNDFDSVDLLIANALDSAAFGQEARLRLRMTKSSAYATTCARNASPHPVSRQYLPGFVGRMTLSDSRHSRLSLATLRPLPSPVTGLPRLHEPPFQRAVPTTPADRAGARVDCFPAHAAFPKWPEGRHPHCPSLTLRPVGLLSRLKRPLSRGSSPSGRPIEPLVSFQTNRQLSGWILPPR